MTIEVSTLQHKPIDGFFVTEENILELAELLKGEVTYDYTCATPSTTTRQEPDKTLRLSLWGSNLLVKVGDFLYKDDWTERYEKITSDKLVQYSEVTYPDKEN